MSKFKYFSKNEFSCPCCGENGTDEKFIEKLDRARGISGIPYVITSGKRCEKHNQEVGGVPESSHKKGLAVDISVTSSRQRFQIVWGLLNAGFTRIGIGKDFIHVDDDQEKPQNLIWDYYNK